MVILFETIHGSRLYGTHVPYKSDHDYYRVVTRDPSVLGHNRRNKQISQKINGDSDVLTIDFSTWVRQLQAGVPQAWEAAFSGMAEIDEIRAFRSSLRAGTSVIETYRRTMKAFAFDERDDGVKKRRHALRLGLNAWDLSRQGWFNPTLTKDQSEHLLELSKQDSEKVYELALRFAEGSANV